MKKQILVFMLSLSLSIFTTSCAFAGGQNTYQGTTSQMEKGQPVIVNGKVAFAKALGGYYVNGKDPAGEFMIMNQDPKLLEGLLKSGKNITIDGRLRGADFLFIKKIDGQPYQGKPASK